MYSKNLGICISEIEGTKMKKDIFIFEEEEPDEIDIPMLEQIKNDPDCGVFVSEEEAMKELGLA